MAGRSYNFVKGTSDDCRVPGFDDTPGCNARDCKEQCVECHRMAGPCDCTCNSMSPSVCVITTPVENCPCEDGGTKTGHLITGIRIGWSDAPEGSTLAAIAALTCAGDATVLTRLVGSGPTVSAEENCPIDPDLLITVLANGNETNVDVPAVTLTPACDQGSLYSSADDLGITIVPRDDHLPACSQTGGHRMLGLQFADNCGNTLCYCPFTGVVGKDFTCITPVDYCCVWTFERTVTPCDEDGNGGSVTVTATRVGSCSCIPTASVTIDGTNYPLSGTSAMIDHPVSPCSTGVTTVDVNYTVTFPGFDGGCEFDCSAFNINSTESVTL